MLLSKYKNYSQLGDLIITPLYILITIVERALKMSMGFFFVPVIMCSVSGCFENFVEEKADEQDSPWHPYTLLINLSKPPNKAGFQKPNQHSRVTKGSDNAQ